MATVATRLGRNLVQQKPKMDLNPTGLLMEGDYAQNPALAHFEQRTQALANEPLNPA